MLARGEHETCVSEVSYAAMVVEVGDEFLG
jgi:hypothetical protein